jgi:aspartate aminotransferase-like enzyme
VGVWFPILKVMCFRFNLEINTGLGPTSGKIIRIGCFGPNAQPEIADKILEALKDGLTHFANT